MRQVQPPNRDTKPPRLEAPAGACDTHLHIYGRPERYPLSSERNYTPDPRSTLDDYIKVHRTLGLERAVIVTGSAYGTDNQITLDALARMTGPGAKPWAWQFPHLSGALDDPVHPILANHRSPGAAGFAVVACPGLSELHGSVLHLAVGGILQGDPARPRTLVGCLYMPNGNPVPGPLNFRYFVSTR